jgi:chromate reductase, NAD(P)H dehydrogenase (quinone)
VFLSPISVFVSPDPVYPNKKLLSFIFDDNAGILGVSFAAFYNLLLGRRCKMPIEIVTICGSVRPGNYTSMALALVVDELRKDSKIKVVEIALGSLDLPVPGKPTQDSSAERFREMVKNATGLVIATPEYHGSFSSVVKLAIENLGFPSVLAGKPMALLGVAAGRIGAIKSLEHLRSVCSHVGAIVLPNLVSVSGVQEHFDERGACLDHEIEKHIRSVGTTLLHYIEGAICPKIALEALVRSGGEKSMA